MDEATIQQFAIWLRRSTRTEHTVRTALNAFRRVTTAVPSLTVAALQDYFYTEYRAGRKGAYLNKYVDVMRLYGKFQNTTIYKELVNLPEADPLKQTLTDQQIEDFLAVPCPVARNPLIHERWTNFWRVAFYTACRLKEAAQLEPRDFIYGEMNAIYFREEIVKTRRARAVPIAPAILAYIEPFVARCSQRYVFGTKKDKPVGDKMWNEEWWFRLNEIGVTPRPGLTPNSSRHSGATRWLLKSKIDLKSVQALMGHANITTTARYLHPDLASLTDEIKKDTLNRRAISATESLQIFLSKVQELQDLYLDDSRFFKQATIAPTGFSLQAFIKDVPK